MKNRLTSRRELLLQALPACTLCLGITRLSFGAATYQVAQPLPFSKRIAEKVDMSYSDFFRSQYGSIIPMLKYLSDQIGKEKFFEILKKGVDEYLSRMNAANKKEFKSDLANYVVGFKSNVTYQHALTYSFIKETEKEVEFSITECLWAKTFRQFDAADLGYAMICYPDVPYIKVYNPKITLNRPKVLMQGDDECRFRYTMEA